MIKNTPEELDKLFKIIKEDYVLNPEFKLRVIDLRNYIDEIYPREVETGKQDIVDLKHSFIGLNKRVKHIEECLGIDFKLDNLIHVDYNFIKDIHLRDKAVAFYREMLRFEYGTRNHKICFGEFCRLATIQLELMLNYFFNSENFIDLLDEEIDKLAQKRYDKAYKIWEGNKKGKEPKKSDFVATLKKYKKDTLTNIFLSYKSKIFVKTYLGRARINYNSITSLSIWISKMRNRKSHGGWSSLGPYEEDYLTEEEKQNLEQFEKELINKVNEYNLVNKKQILIENKRMIASEEVWKSMSSDLIDLYNNSFAPLQWISEKSFNDVNEFLRIIASTCAKELKKKK